MGKYLTLLDLPWARARLAWSPHQHNIFPGSGSQPAVHMFLWTLGGSLEIMRTQSVTNIVWVRISSWNAVTSWHGSWPASHPQRDSAGGADSDLLTSGERVPRVQHRGQWAASASQQQQRQQQQQQACPAPTTSPHAEHVPSGLHSASTFDISSGNSFFVMLRTRLYWVGFIVLSKLIKEMSIIYIHKKNCPCREVTLARVCQNTSRTRALAQCLCLSTWHTCLDTWGLTGTSPPRGAWRGRGRSGVWRWAGWCPSCPRGRPPSPGAWPRSPPQPGPRPVTPLSTNTSRGEWVK